VGYVICPDGSSAKRLRARHVEWPVSSLACAVVPELLAAADLAGWAGEIVRLRERLVERLREHEIESLPSDAPWVLVPDAGDLRERLARGAVLVRDCASFGLVDTVRIAVPDAAGLERLSAALAGPGH
jgi:histidinol-phosphate/aromatic aminotransferase/cobyric acid decarboxylase-like protein